MHYGIRQTPVHASTQEKQIGCAENLWRWLDANGITVFQRNCYRALSLFNLSAVRISFHGSICFALGISSLHAKWTFFFSHLVPIILPRVPFNTLLSWENTEHWRVDCAQRRLPVRYELLFSFVNRDIFFFAVSPHITPHALQFNVFFFNKKRNTKTRTANASTFAREIC